MAGGTAQVQGLFTRVRLSNVSRHGYVFRNPKQNTGEMTSNIKNYK